jgi:hypothetical protein
MSLAAQGAYRNLLDLAWERGALLPNTPAVFWRFALAQSAEEFSAVAGEVMPMFVPTEDGQNLHNETLTAEWNEATAKMEKIHEIRAEAGRRGAAAKHGSSKCLAIAEQNLATGQDNTGQKDTNAELRSAVARVFSYYLSKTGRNPNQYDFTDKRQTKGMCRLKEFLKKCDGDMGRATAMMNRAVDGICADDWDERHKFREWESHLFNSQEQAEKWRTAPLFKSGNGKAMPSPVTNHNADAILARQLRSAR